ncbi:MAG: PHP domain-containing protein, partial [Fuerstiella sp.]
MPEIPEYQQPVRRPPPNLPRAGQTPLPYAELHCRTNFSFLEGASHADELVATAQSLGYRALAITDRNSLAGVVRAHVAAKKAGLKLLIGAEIVSSDGPTMVLLATDRAAYGRLSQLITIGRRRAPKGECRLTFADIVEHNEGLLCCVPISTESQQRYARTFQTGVRSEIAEEQLTRCRSVFDDRCYALAELHLGPNDRAKLHRWVEICDRLNVPLAVANDVHYHATQRRPLHDVVTAIRCNATLQSLGHELHPNGERFLKPTSDLLRLFEDRAELLQRTVEIADRCTFSLDELRYEYPEELVPDGITSSEHLADLTWRGVEKRYPDGVPEPVTNL